LSCVIVKSAISLILLFTLVIGYTRFVVRTLLSPYLGKGHILYIDNWYSSPTLLANLFQNHTSACGTVGGRHTIMPCFRKILRKGQIEVCNDTLLAMKWKAKWDVHKLTTVHKQIQIKFTMQRRNYT